MRNNLVGQEFKTNNCGNLIVVAMESNTRCTVKFQTSGYVKTNVHTRELRNGEVGDPYYPKIRGVGYLGVGKHKSKCGSKNSKEYSLWYAMLSRCYTDSYDPCYSEATVAKYWHNFQTFAEDIKALPGYEDRLQCHLDKDLRVPGTKIYSRETCSFVPEIVNCTTYGNKSKVVYTFQGTKGVYTCTSVKAFCELHSLNRKHMAAMIRGERATVRGLTFVSKKPL